jgi:hypothetical protein
MLPLYIFYSMFGFQRTGDSIWSATDQRTKGFLIGATAGRTTLNGEGLQHEDGHSLLLAASNPGVVAYDPSFAFEIACIVEDGVNRMVGEAGEDVLYYLTVYNEPAPQPAMPEHVSEDDVVRGIYRYAAFEDERSHRAQLLTSGSAMTMALEAQRLLGDDWDVAADLWSVPGWVGLHRDALDCSGHNLVHPNGDPRVPTVTHVLNGAQGPFIGVTDYQRAVPGLIAPWVPGPYRTLGTDGFGRSDTRPALRRLFRIDAAHIVVATLAELAEAGEVKRETVGEAIKRYEVDPEDRNATPYYVDVRYENQDDEDGEHGDHVALDALGKIVGELPRIQMRRLAQIHLGEPRIELHLVHDAEGVPFLFLTGREPDLQWERFATSIEGLVRTFGVGLCVELHAIPMSVPHTRPIAFTAHGNRADLVDEVPHRETRALTLVLRDRLVQGHGSRVWLCLHFPLQSSFQPLVLE